MRIAQVAPLYESVPPKLYGGTERVVSWLTEELVSLGHDVTLFASGDSMTKARLVPVCRESLRLSPDCVDQLAHHIVLLEHVLREKDEFDLIHFHIDYLHFPFSSREKYMHVSTLHGRLDLPDLVPLYEFFRGMPVISISDAQRDPLPDLNWQGTVHHGLPESDYRLYGGPGKYLAFLGRVSPEKGVDNAIAIARAAGIPLKIAAKIDKADQEYFDSCIRPLIEDLPDVEFIGELGYPEKHEFLGNALALLFPIAWPEPFGLVMIEAMACGTPVIAYPFGSVNEVVKDQVSGYVVPDLKSAVKAVLKVHKLDRRKVRRHFRDNFTAERMTKNYLKIYERLIARKEKMSAGAVPDGVLSWKRLASPSSTT